MVLIDEQAVGQVGIGLAPNELGRIKFGRVAGKLFHVQPGMIGQKCLDGRVAMDRGAIPEGNNGPGNLRHQRLEKTQNIGTFETTPAELQVEGHMPAFGRDDQGRDGGELLVLKVVGQLGRLPARRPGAFDIGYE
jgi:hypothetical protein